MEEVSSGLISFTELALPRVHEANRLGDLKAVVEETLVLVGASHVGGSQETFPRQEELR